jgi:hypothetical protein
MKGVGDWGQEQLDTEADASTPLEAVTKQTIENCD